MTFNTWFLEQHGKRPGAAVTDKVLENAIRAGRDAETVLAQRTLWDALRQSALYAWQVKKDET